MANNVLIFADGTGQGASMPDKQTSILRLFRATENAAPGRQLAYYDPGLGATDANVERDYGWWRWGHDLLSKATGLGISQNIKDCYAGLIRRYRPGDRIYLFGFSRGAYTVRSLGGVLALCGVPLRDAQGRSPAVDEEACAALVNEAVDKIYKHYGKGAKEQERKDLGAEFRRKYGGNLADGNPPVPHFIGVFDTVRALGIPGSSGLIGWRHAFHDDTLNSRVPHARQALAIDENRAAFKPKLWDETPSDAATGRIKQRWFPGVHSDVGGGYEDDRGLADLALQWMVDEATSVPDPIAVDRNMLALAPAFNGKQHDERTGLGKAWIEGTREEFRPSVLHEGFVKQRFDEPHVPTMKGNGPYRPKALRDHPDYKDRF